MDARPRASILFQWESKCASIPPDRSKNMKRRLRCLQNNFHLFFASGTFVMDARPHASILFQWESKCASIPPDRSENMKRRFRCLQNHCFCTRTSQSEIRDIIWTAIRSRSAIDRGWANRDRSSSVGTSLVERVSSKFAEYSLKDTVRFHLPLCETHPRHYDFPQKLTWLWDNFWHDLCMFWTNFDSFETI